MLKKIDNTIKQGNAHISILYPGLILTNDDTGFYSIGRIDHASINAGAVIKMHPHINDDILSYFRSGKVKHTDSEGFEEYITPGRLMLMKAGRMFQHEEAILEDVHGLQIFIRPGQQDNNPEVIFDELETIHSVNAWRLIASPDKTKSKLQLSSDTYISDAKLYGGASLSYSLDHKPNYAGILYVFQGTVKVNNDIILGAGESLYVWDESITLTTDTEAELVLFETNITSAYYSGGMYSGNQKYSK